MLKSRLARLMLLAGITLVVVLTAVLADQVAADDPISRRLAMLAQRGVNVRTTPVSVPLPRGVTVLPTPPAVNDAALQASSGVRPTLVPIVSGPCKNDPELFAYIGRRAQALAQAAAEPKKQMPATVNFKSPVGDEELERLAKDYHLVLFNLFYVTNVASSGVYGYKQDTVAGTQQRLRSQAGDDRLRVEGYLSVEAQASLADWARLNTHPNVLLADLGEWKPIAGGKFKSEFPMGISWRYEQACR